MIFLHRTTYEKVLIFFFVKISSRVPDFLKNFPQKKFKTVVKKFKLSLFSGIKHFVRVENSRVKELEIPISFFYYEKILRKKNFVEKFIEK